MALRWRLVVAFAALIALAVLLSLGVAYWNMRQEMAGFIQDVGATEAQDLADWLSEECGADWECVAFELEDMGYMRPTAPDEQTEFYQFVGMQVRVVDDTNTVQVDTFGEQTNTVYVPHPTDHRAPLYDYENETTAGQVVVTVQETLFAEEIARFLNNTMQATLISGLVTGGLALLVGLWLAQRITAPVTALTQAATALAAAGRTEPLPVHGQDELGRMSVAFNQLTAALQTQKALRQRLINDVSHELNTPLSVIQLEAKGLRDELQTPAEAATHILQEVTRLRNLVQDLTWLAETDTGQVQLNCVPVVLAQVLPTELARWQNEAEQRQVTLQLAPVPPLPTLSLDPLRFSQMLGNLLYNALQHTPAGGHITLSATRYPAPGRTPPTTLEPGAWVVVAVQDTGAGIAAADLPHVFERFYRTDQSRQTHTGGRGLGLAIVHQLVTLHGGHVWAESTLGAGSTFFMALPLPPPA